MKGALVKKMMKPMAAAFALALTAPAAMAAGDSGVYVLGGLGYSNFGNYGKLDQEARDEGIVINKRDRGDIAWKLQLGYQFNKYFAIEGGYFNLGKASANLSIPGTDISAKDTFKSSGFNLNAVGILPLGNSSFSLLGKVGVFTAKSKTSVSGIENGENFSERYSKSKTGVLFGVGASYNFTPQFAVRAEYERYNGLRSASDEPKIDADVFSVGVSYRF
jgi:OOP family OmpA-OmpF porin